MSKEQFKGMLQSFLIKVNRANLPLALDDYSAHLSNLFKAKDQRIAELEEQLKNARKETANKVIKRVEELSVFDFKAYEEMDFRRYIISEMALDNILKEYGGNDVKN